MPELFAVKMVSKLNILWCHDLANLRSADKFKSVLWNIDKVMTVSQYMTEQYKEVYGLPDELFWTTRNGIDLDLISTVTSKNPTRKHKQLVYAARPERGLDILLESIMPKIWEKDPGITLKVCGYNNTVPEMQPFHDYLNGLITQSEGKAEWVGHLTKEQLYALYSESTAYVYPTPSYRAQNFAEVSCVVGSTLIDLPRDYSKNPDGIPIKDLVGIGGFPVYAYDNENERITLGTVKWVAKTKINAEVWKLTLDDDNILRATPDHKIMLRDGTYKELKDLRPGESLMPLYKKFRVNVNCNNGIHKDEAILVGEWKEGRELLSHGIKAGLKKYHSLRNMETVNTEYNHKVVSIEFDGYEDVYDMEVDKYHNFVASGIVVHNCITAMEAMACGLPFITSNKGALPETLDKDACFLIDGDPWTEEYQNTFVEAVFDVIGAVSLGMSGSGTRKAATLGWKELAIEWGQGFNTLIKERNSNTYGLAKHFIRHSDIEAAKRVLMEHPGEERYQKLGIYINDKWNFVDTPEKYKAHYVSMGDLTNKRLSQIPWTEDHFNHSDEKRFALIEECLKDSEVETILDLGTGHGWMTVYLERRIGKKWTGVDVDPGAVKWSRFFADKFAKTPENLIFYTEDDFLEQTKECEYDCLIMSEVLEHCINPKATVETMEKLVKPNGLVIITVPYGPREYPEFKTNKYLNHVHELDFNTLRDMFGDKPGVEILGTWETTISELGEPAGFYFIRYRADQKPLGNIDWDKKLTIQRPKQTVSVSMIAGPGAEDNLHWCLKSVEPIADEIIIADCGMTEEAKRIAWSYPDVKIVQGADPKVVGFDEARNKSLNFCTMEWVLWIDCDEKLIGIEKLHKYLRENIFSGYSIRQHHFACDTSFQPDMPVRLFRNRPNKEGKAMKFFGSCHEHPEYALNEGPGSCIILSDVHIAHVGYLVEEGRRKRFSRNYPLLQMSNQKYPDRVLNKYFTMRDNMLLCGYELQSNGGQVTDTIRHRSSETIDLYRTYFGGKGVYLNTDALSYYSQACSILGIGAEINFCVSNGSGQPEMKKVRFANMGDLQKELDWKAKEVMGKYEHPWW